MNAENLLKPEYVIAAMSPEGRVWLGRRDLWSNSVFYAQVFNDKKEATNTVRRLTSARLNSKWDFKVEKL